LTNNKPTSSPFAPFTAKTKTSGGYSPAPALYRETQARNRRKSFVVAVQIRRSPTNPERVNKKYACRMQQAVKEKLKNGR